MEEQKNMKLYFGIPKKLYKHPIMLKAVAEIYKYFKEQNIQIESFFNPATDFDKLGIEIPDSLKGKNEIEKFIQNSCIELALGHCDGIVYMNTFTKKGNVSFTPGVKAEVNNRLRQGNTRIFRLVLTNTGDIDTTDIGEIVELSNQTINEMAEKLYNKYSPESQNWVLKTTDDYFRLYKTQPEMLEHLYQQCYDPELTKIGVHGILKHRSFIYEISNKGKGKNKIPRFSCYDHYTSRHAYADPRSQLFETVCPYFLNKKLFHNKVYEMIPKFPTDADTLTNMIVSNRVIHKFMYIFDESVHRIGVCLRDEKKGEPIIGEDGRYIPDPKLIKGVQIVIDMDIKKSVKSSGKTFFDPVIYAEYVKALDLLLIRILGENYDTKDVKIMFSGNGLYIILRKYIDFSKSGVKNYYIHETAWDIMRDSYQQTLVSNGIKHIQIEEGYGWNRYFKIAGTLHAGQETASIPLNIDKMLGDHEYINYIKENSSIKNLLDNKVRYSDILKASGW